MCHHCLEQAVQGPARRRARRWLSSWPLQRNAPVHFGDNGRLADPIGGARPRPFFRAAHRPGMHRIIVDLLGEKVSVTPLVVMMDVLPPPDWPRIIRHGSTGPLELPSWNPGPVFSNCTRRSESSRNPPSFWPTFAPGLCITAESALLVPSGTQSPILPSQAGTRATRASIEHVKHRSSRSIAYRPRQALILSIRPILVTFGGCRLFFPPETRPKPKQHAN